jgi:hypothetical protein
MYITNNNMNLLHQVRKHATKSSRDCITCYHNYQAFEVHVRTMRERLDASTTVVLCSVRLVVLSAVLLYKQPDSYGVVNAVHMISPLLHLNQGFETNHYCGDHTIYSATHVHCTQ